MILVTGPTDHKTKRRKDVFSRGSDFWSEMSNIRKSKSVIFIISLRFYLLQKTLNIKLLPGLSSVAFKLLPLITGR